MRLSTLLYALGFVSIAISAARYLDGTTHEEPDKRRDGLFIGEWPPTFFILGKIAEDRERRSELELEP